MKDKKPKKGKKGRRADITVVRALPPPDRSHDPTLLAAARVQWQHGDWDDLTRIEVATLTDHPDRARVALMVAAAHGQLGAIPEARAFARLALDWGCSKTLLAQVLISTAHNGLARVATCLHDPAAEAHFTTALRIAEPGGNLTLLSRLRQLRETTRLGLLPEAAALLAIDLTQIAKTPSDQADRLVMLDSRLAALQQALAVIRGEHRALDDNQP